MTTKLTQKHLIKGRHEFEIIDEQVNIKIKMPFKKEETLSVMLAVVNPEPLINQSQLEFVSRVNGEALISISLAKPNVDDFNQFVNTLKQRAAAEYNAFIGMTKVTEQPKSTINNNVYDEPPEFSEASTTRIIKTKKVNTDQLDNAIYMLETYVVDYDETNALVSALKDLKKAPDEESKLIQVATTFNSLEISQGAVLTYAPYIAIMLSDDPFKMD